MVSIRQMRRRELEELGLSVNGVANYAVNAGWRKVPSSIENLIVFEGPLDDYGNPIHLILPVHDNFSDSLLRLAEAIDLLANVEDRSALAIFEDIQARQKLESSEEKILAKVEPWQLVAYLKAHGWEQGVKIAEGRGEVWRLKLTLEQYSELRDLYLDPDGEFELLVPLKQGLKDHNSRVIEILNTLEIVENRPRLQILSDLLSEVGDRSVLGSVEEIQSATYT